MSHCFDILNESIEAHFSLAISPMTGFAMRIIITILRIIPRVSISLTFVCRLSRCSQPPRKANTACEYYLIATGRSAMGAPCSCKYIFKSFLPAYPFYPVFIIWILESIFWTAGHLDKPWHLLILHKKYKRFIPTITLSCGKFTWIGITFTNCHWISHDYR